MTIRSTAGLAVALLALQAAVAESAELLEFGSPSAVTKGGDLRGRIVETRDGEELGRVHDFAVDLGSGRIGYVVVSVGSFLIQDSLIAVAPDALRESADADGRLVLETDARTLREAQRFSAGNWPVRADVVASARPTEPGEEAAAAAADDTDEDRPRRGTATIVSNTKTATLSAGERTIVEQRAPAKSVPEQAPAANEAPAAKRGFAAQRGSRSDPTTPFGRLDEDGDGVLNRAEIAHELTRRDNYSDIDMDGSGTIDPTEFDALLESRGSNGNGASTP